MIFIRVEKLFRQSEWGANIGGGGGSNQNAAREQIKNVNLKLMHAVLTPISVKPAGEHVKPMCLQMQNVPEMLNRSV